MEHGADFGAIRDLLVFLVVAGVIVPVFHRLKISPVIGFLIGGVALGPHGLASLADDLPWLGAMTLARLKDVAPLAELGIVFLLFAIGLELSFERLSRLKRYVFGLGLAQLLVTALVLGGLARLLGLPATAAIILGLALALSSTAIVLPILAERRRLAGTAGRVAFAVLLMQDLALAPILIAVGALTGAGGSSFATAFAGGVLAVAAILVGGRLLLRPLMRLVARSGSQELFLAACLLVVLVSGLLTAAAGQSMALGALVAGLLLAETEYRHEIEVTIAPFKGLLLGLFFLTAGAQLDLPRLVSDPLLPIALAIGVIVMKVLVLGGLLRLFRVTEAARAEAALALAPAGEFTFVVVSAGMAAGAIAPQTGSVVAIAALLSMFLIPLLHTLGMQLSRNGQRRAAEALPELPASDEPVARVLVIGFGRVGQLVAEMLTRHNVPYLAVDSDPELVARARKRGRAVVFGDGSRRDFLRRIGIERARGLVATSGDADAVDRLVAAARAERPDLVIIARSRDPDHAMRLYRLGASDVVPETVEASLQLAEAVLVDIGVPMGLVIASVHEKRDEFRAELQKGGAHLRPKRAGRRPPLKPDAPEPGENGGP